MIVTVLISVTSHMATAGIYNLTCLTTSSFSFCLQQVSQMLMALYLVKLPKPSFLRGLGH